MESPSGAPLATQISLPSNGVQLLLNITNKCFQLGHFPTQWKCAEVILIPKPGKPAANLASYRPISLLAVLSKVVEGLLLRRVRPILDEAGLIPDHQFGFRESHGTPDQCHRIVDKILEAFQEKMYCSSVFLDIKQAFDRVWHAVLLYKLKTALPAPYYLLLKSYLEHRRFFVRCGDERSAVMEVRAGVPQGSVVGSVLYTLYTAALIPDPRLLAATYADDTAFLASDTCPQTASVTLQRLTKEMEHHGEP